MRHWHLLYLSLRNRAHGPGAAIVANGREDSLSGLSWRLRTRLFVMGTLEALPFVLGMVLGIDSRTVWGCMGVVLCGLLGSIGVCWVFRRFSPPTAIHCRGKESVGPDGHVGDWASVEGDRTLSAEQGGGAKEDSGVGR
jgi:hypothetical protein